MRRRPRPNWLSRLLLPILPARIVAVAHSAAATSGLRHVSVAAECRALEEHWQPVSKRDNLTR